MLYDRIVLQHKLDILLSFFLCLSMAEMVWLGLKIDIKDVELDLLIIKTLKIKLFVVCKNRAKVVISDKKYYLCNVLCIIV